MGLRHRRSSLRRCSPSRGTGLTGTTSLRSIADLITRCSSSSSAPTSDARILTRSHLQDSCARTSRWMSSSGGFATSGRRRGNFQRPSPLTSRRAACRGRASTRHAAASTNALGMAFRQIALQTMVSRGTFTSATSLLIRSGSSLGCARCTPGCCTCLGTCGTLATSPAWATYFTPSFSRACRIRFQQR